MLRSMYSGISGMQNMQIKLDTIGNNIANVNTFGFKKGRTTFKDMVSQQMAGATGPGQNLGGVNARQVGLGMQLASIDTIHTQGSLQNTNRELDLGISGDGYFVVGTTNGAGTPTGVGDLSFTRAGNFYLDQEGFIVNSDGLYLMGARPGADGAFTGVDAFTVNENNFGRIRIPSDAQSFSIGADGKVMFINNDGLQVAGQVGLAKFSNNEGLQKIGNNLYAASANSGNLQGANLTLGNFEALNAYISIPQFGAAGTGSLVAGTLEMSNVDLSQEFTEMIVAQRGFQANTRIITTSDEILQELVNLKR
ncbi:flagellar basal body rod protein FlgG [Halalkalibacter akibai]|uniref:Flagellar hook protein FlgE n=1 Tax=Halalkalibacter akibai (strain ATCC 43226 / DSM 21942 / CIP 109018 / JCM 9157 / 1139) TaxID=1236973 RepID=W4QXJ3_HALA3|nr:flagellar basal body rod protein FlgG [Halalkalibacter akibai]GAE36034.1 flagellar basal-body rod protein FlgG [Halalkalibacter akibai JCM 9157]